MGEIDQPVVVAVDGGGSKTDAVAVALDGLVVRRASGPTTSPHFIGVEAAIDQIDALVREVADGHPIVQVNIYLSGLDLPGEVKTFATAIAKFGWSTEATIVDNDLFALLRSGTSEPDAVAVVCGSGINALGRRADGATARFAALGTISGDWGGGTGIGEAAIWHAARAADRRGPATTLTAAVARTFKLPTIADVTEALHLGTIVYSDLGLLSPVVFDEADKGDQVAVSLVERQGREIAIMAISCLDRLDLLDRAVPVVLGGGVVAGGHALLWSAIEAEFAERAPRAVLVHVSAPPLLGAALLALESAHAEPGSLERAITQLS